MTCKSDTESKDFLTLQNYLDSVKLKCWPMFYMWCNYSKAATSSAKALLLLQKSTSEQSGLAELTDCLLVLAFSSPCKRKRANNPQQLRLFAQRCPGHMVAELKAPCNGRNCAS